MQVYIEYVVINNLIINALILVLALKFVRYNINWLAILFASALGCIYAIFLPLFDILNIIIIKIALASIMVFVVTGKCSAKKYFSILSIFILTTFFLGGTTIGLQNIIGITSQQLNQSLLPFFVGMSGLILIIAQTLIKKHIILTRRKNMFSSSVEICVKGKKVVCQAYYDSGNRLYYHNKPAIIIDTSIAKQLCTDWQLAHIKDNTFVSTVSGQKSIKILNLDYIKIGSSKDKNYGVVAGISDCLKGEYKVLMHCDL